MTTLDIFFAVVVVAPAVGLLMLTLAYAGITGMSYIANATANIPSYYPCLLYTSPSPRDS